MKEIRNIIERAKQGPQCSRRRQFLKALVVMGLLLILTFSGVPGSIVKNTRASFPDIFFLESNIKFNFLTENKAVHFFFILKRKSYS